MDIAIEVIIAITIPSSNCPAKKLKKILFVLSKYLPKLLYVLSLNIAFPNFLINSNICFLSNNKYTEAMKLVKECDEELKNEKKKISKIALEDGTLEDFTVKDA